jgi:transposase
MLSEFEKKLIIEKYKNGDTIKKIADAMNINNKTVILWLKRYVEVKNIEKKKKIYNKKTSKEEDEKILKIAEDNEKFKLNYLQNEAKKQDIIISRTTIWRRLKDNDYIYGNYLKKPKLTELQKTKRLDWAKKHLNYDWSKVLFSDEATIYLDNGGKCWYKFGHRKEHRTVKYFIKRNMWAFINLLFGLCDFEIFNWNLNADEYEGILKAHLIDAYNNEYIYQQDNHPVHNSKKIKKFLSDNNIIVLDWPANSPDLNPIENYWSLIKHELSLRILTPQNFDKNIIEVILSINTSIIYNLIGSMHIRIQKVIDNKGDVIDY